VAQRVVHSITEVPTPQGVAYSPETNKLFVGSDEGKLYAALLGKAHGVKGFPVAGVYQDRGRTDAAAFYFPYWVGSYSFQSRSSSDSAISESLEYNTDTFVDIKSYRNCCAIGSAHACCLRDLAFEAFRNFFGCFRLAVKWPP
jgi:hypothetical protein